MGDDDNDTVAPPPPPPPAEAAAPETSGAFTVVPMGAVLHQPPVLIAPMRARLEAMTTLDLPHDPVQTDTSVVLYYEPPPLTIDTGRHTAPRENDHPAAHRQPPTQVPSRPGGAVLVNPPTAGGSATSVVVGHPPALCVALSPSLYQALWNRAR